MVVLFSVPFSLAGEKLRLRDENNAFRELIARLRANQIGSDFRVDVTRRLFFAYPESRKLISGTRLLLGSYFIYDIL